MHNFDLGAHHAIVVTDDAIAQPAANGDVHAIHAHLAALEIRAYA